MKKCHYCGSPIKNGRFCGKKNGKRDPYCGTEWAKNLVDRGVLPVYATRVCPCCGSWFHVFKHAKKVGYCSKECANKGRGFAAAPKKKPKQGEVIDPLDIDSPYMTPQEYWQAELLARVEMVKEGRI